MSPAMWHKIVMMNHHGWWWWCFEMSMMMTHRRSKKAAPREGGRSSMVSESGCHCCHCCYCCHCCHCIGLCYSNRCCLFHCNVQLSPSLSLYNDDISKEGDEGRFLQASGNKTMTQGEHLIVWLKKTKQNPLKIHRNSWSNKYMQTKK